MDLKQLIRDVDVDRFFYFHDGTPVKNLLELTDQLSRISDDLFYFHVNNTKNDFANWIQDVIGDKELSELIRGINNRIEMQIVILRYIVNKIK